MAKKVQVTENHTATRKTVAVIILKFPIFGSQFYGKYIQRNKSHLGQSGFYLVQPVNGLETANGNLYSRKHFCIGLL